MSRFNRYILLSTRKNEGQSQLARSYNLKRRNNRNLENFVTLHANNSASSPVYTFSVFISFAYTGVKCIKTIYGIYGIYFIAEMWKPTRRITYFEDSDSNNDFIHNKLLYIFSCPTESINFQHYF